MTKPHSIDEQDEGEKRLVMGPPPVFLHPQWMLGVVLVLAAVSLLLGVAGHPVWLLIGSPFILTLFVWCGVRLTTRKRRVGGATKATTAGDADGPEAGSEESITRDGDGATR